MNVYFTNLGHHLMNINLSRSPCGRELNYITPRLAALKLQSPKLGWLVEKIIELVTIVFMVIITYILDAYCKSFIAKIPPLACGYTLAAITVFIIDQFISNPCSQEKELQKNENDLIKVLGGLQAFNQLPIIKDIEDEDDLQHLESSDVNYQSITRGFLPDGRFFVALQVQERRLPQPQPVMTILCQSNLKGKNWKVLGHQRSAIGRGDFWRKEFNIRLLIARIHPTHKLI